MRIVGYTNGTGYLCTRDVPLGMAGIMDDVTSIAKKAGAAVASAAPGGVLSTALPIVGGVLGTALGVGTQVWVDSAMAEAQRKAANAAAFDSLKQAGLLAQQQSYQAQVQQQQAQAFNKTAITIGAILAVGVAGYVAYRMLRKRS